MKKKIVIASILKSTDDVRSYWKLAQSFLKTNKYEINIIGNEGKKIIDDNNVTFHSHHVSRSEWIRRWVLRKMALFKIIKERPKLLIITTHELLNTALLAKCIIGCKIVYDVQEDYKKNIRYLNPSLFRFALGVLIRLKEQLSRLYVDQYWLAEKCYSELNFTKGKSLVVENKAYNYASAKRKFDIPYLLFSGTLSSYSGIHKALAIYVKIREQYHEAKLMIVGQYHDPSIGKMLEEMQLKYPAIDLNISIQAIPHSEVLKAIYATNLGMIGYVPNDVNRKKIPTKLYEYSRYKLPYIVDENSYWAKEGQHLGGCIPVQIDNPDPRYIIEKWKSPDKLFPNPYPISATWEYESEKLIDAIKNLISG